MIAVVTQDNLQPPKTSIKNFGPWLKEKASKVFTKKTLYKRVPIINWLPKYNFEWGIGDLVAGITVGLTVIPQALAYSNIAGLPPQVCVVSSYENNIRSSFQHSSLYIFARFFSNLILSPVWSIRFLPRLFHLHHLGQL